MKRKKAVEQTHGAAQLPVKASLVKKRNGTTSSKAKQQIEDIFATKKAPRQVHWPKLWPAVLADRQK